MHVCVYNIYMREEGGSLYLRQVLYFAWVVLMKYSISLPHSLLTPLEGPWFSQFQQSWSTL